MRINREQSNPVFTSKIKFVDKHTFNLLQLYISEKAKITSYDISNRSGYLLNQSKVLTTDVRTCTGGFVIDPDKKMSTISVHLKNSEKNLENIDNLNPFISGNNAFFIGAKRRFDDKPYEFAHEVFKKISNLAKRKSIKTTTLEGLNEYCGVDLAYWGKKDTIFVGLHRIIPQKGKPPQKKYIQIDNLTQLKKYFEKIKISQTDELEFNQRISTKELAEFIFS